MFYNFIFFAYLDLLLPKVIYPVSFGAFIVFFKIDYIDDCKTNNIQDRVDLINLMYDKVFLQVILSHKLVVE